MPFLPPGLSRYTRAGKELGNLGEGDPVVAHFEDGLDHSLFGHVVNLMPFDRLGTVSRIGRSPLFLALPDRDTSTDESRSDRIFGAEKFTGNLLRTEAQNDVFLVEQNRVLIKRIVAK